MLRKPGYVYRAPRGVATGVEGAAPPGWPLRRRVDLPRGAQRDVPAGGHRPPPPGAPGAPAPAPHTRRLTPGASDDPFDDCFTDQRHGGHGLAYLLFHRGGGTGEQIDHDTAE